MEKKRILVVMRHSPYGSSLAKAAIDVALAGAAFDQPIDLLFTGEGVLQLVPDQDSQSAGKKSIARQLSALPLYDIDYVYVDADAAARYRIDPAGMPVKAQLLDTSEMRKLLVDYDHLLGL